jgi:hypothetical protein
MHEDIDEIQSDCSVSSKIQGPSKMNMSSSSSSSSQLEFQSTAKKSARK